jgi:putative transposase
MDDATPVTAHVMPPPPERPLIALTSLDYVPQKADKFIDDRGQECRLIGTDWRRLPGEYTYDIWFIHVEQDDQTALPFPVKRDIFLADLQAGHWTRSINQSRGKPVRSEQAVASAMTAWKSIHTRIVDPKHRDDESLALLFDYEPLEMKGCTEPCLVYDQRLYRKHNRKYLLLCYQKVLGHTAKTLLKWLRMYWQGGMVQSALAPNWDNSGEDRRTLTEEKLLARGAPGRKIGGKKGQSGIDPFRLTPAQEDAIWAQALPILKDPRRSAAKAYREVCGMVGKGEDGKLRLEEKGTYISQTQFYNICRKRMGRLWRIKRKAGRGKWEKDHAAHTGTVLQEAAHAGHQYEIDSTIADEELVSDDRSQVLGKPTVYFIVDRYSTFIPGFQVSLDAPSWPNAVEAYLSIYEDPQKRCEKYGARYQRHLHVAAGVTCDTLVGDRGSDYICDMSDSFPNELGISMVNLPARMCTLHGPVESRIGLHHCSLANDAPGYQPPADQMKRQRQTYEDKAERTLKEFFAEVQEWVDLHNETIFADMKQPEEAIWAKVPKTPIAMWNWSVETHLGELAIHSIDDVYVSLLYEAEASVTPDGIQVGKLFFTSPEIEKRREWLTMARKKRFAVWVKYDRRRTDDIIVLDPLLETNHLKATLTKSCEKYGGRSWAEAEFLISLDEKTNEDAKRFNELKRQEYAQHAQPRREAGQKAAEEAKARAKAEGRSRTSNKVEARAEAAAKHTQQQAAGHMEHMFGVDQTATQPSPPPAPPEGRAEALSADAQATASAGEPGSSESAPVEAAAAGAGKTARKSKSNPSRQTVVQDPDKAMEDWDN